MPLHFGDLSAENAVFPEADVDSRRNALCQNADADNWTL
jgi:hypothetical protein